jgi:membrane protein required for colicin V production
MLAAILQWTLIDWAILIFIAFTTFSGWRDGFLYGLLSISSWFISYLVARSFGIPLAENLAENVGPYWIRLGLGYFGVFILSMIVLSIGFRGLRYLFRKTGADGPDQALGLFFGALRGLFILHIIVFLLQLTPVKNTDWWQHSVFIQYIMQSIYWIDSYIIPKLPTLFTTNST